MMMMMFISILRERCFFFGGGERFGGSLAVTESDSLRVGQEHRQAAKIPAFSWPTRAVG